MSRLFALETPLPAARPQLKALAAHFVLGDQPGAEHADWPQALMDLGATICRPKSPLCEQCPVAFGCAALVTGEPGRYPLKSKKAERPHRRGIAWVLRDGQGRVALVRRPAKGLLGGMLGLPTSDWSDAPDKTPPVAADWQDAGSIDHVFTHFSLTLTVKVAGGAGDFVWMEEAGALAALPTVFRKALERGLGD